MGLFDWLRAPGRRRKALEEFEKRLEILEKNQRGGVHDSDACASSDARLAVLEKDRTELFRRIDETNKRVDQRLSVLEENRTDLYARSDQQERKLNACGMPYLNARFDSRIIRLEILEFYSRPENMHRLNPREKELLEELRSDYDYERNSGRVISEDAFYCRDAGMRQTFQMGEEDGLWYALIGGKRIFCGENRRDALEYIETTVNEIDGDTPHRYLNPQEDGIDVPDGAILLDIGAAEGYFGMKYLERCKKVYFFECDERWLRLLRKTCEPYGDKVEIVDAYVGDEKGQLSLDDFFKTREKPNFIKMDVEGAERSVLYSMRGLLKDMTLPMTLLVCAYHRQEDWDRYEALLRDRFELYSSDGYFWNKADPYPPFFRHGIMRAVKKTPGQGNKTTGGQENAFSRSGDREDYAQT